MHEDIDYIIFDEKQIQDRVRELGRQITEDYQELLENSSDGQLLIAVCLLRGAVTFMADLMRAVDIPIEYDFISISSYGDASRPGAVRLIRDLDRPIGGRNVLIVDDIIDTGNTLRYLCQSLLAREPSTIRKCILINKTPRRQVDMSIDYVGFTVEEDLFVVGYGMDYAEKYRNLPHIVALKPGVITR
ncbi:MAG: hypoxanthine phosphoribosyltransferase [Candidatus Bipolaricaulia bacterium]